MNILFITSNRVGDAVLTTGLLAWLEARYTDARFTIACGPVAKDLFRAVPRLDRVIVLKKKKWNGHWLELWRLCSGARWDLIVDMRNSVVSRLLRTKRRAYPPAHYTGRHKVIDNAAALGVDPPPPPFIWTDKRAEKEAERLVPEARMVLALGPSANWPAKQWPAEKYARLGRLLTSREGPMPATKILIVAAPHEREQIKAMFEGLPSSQIIDAIGHDLLTVAACLRRCRLFVGNDSGLMHIAAAMRVPTLGLFGPGYPAIYGPWGDHTAYVRTPEKAEELLARIDKTANNTPNLMQSLTLEAAYQAATGLLNTNEA